MGTTPISSRRAAASSVILFAENVVRLAITAGISFAIARALGPEKFGILNFASALMFIFLGASSLGMEVPLVLRLSQGEPEKKLLANALLLRWWAAMLACVCAAFAAWFLKADDPAALTVTLIVALSILGYAPSVFDYGFKARVQATPPALARLASTVASAAAKLFCLTLENNLIWLAWTVVFESCVSSILLWLAWRRAQRNALPQAQAAKVQAPESPAHHTRWTLLRDCAPYLLAHVATVIYMKIDVVLLGHLASNSQTGIYSLVQKLSEVLYIVPVVLVDSVYPVLARRSTSASLTQSQVGQTMFDLAFAGSTIAVFLGLAIVGPVVDWLFGPRYAPTTALFQIHAWTCLSVALTVASSRWMAAIGLQRFAPWLALLGAVINASLNWLMIPHWGAMGAACAALIAYTSAGFLSSFAIPQLRPIGLMQARALWPWNRLLAQLRHR